MVGDAQADRVVPPTGFTARLTVLAAAAMAFLAVFALALSLATGRLATRWSDALTGTATIRITAPEDQLETQVAAVLKLLETTPGIATARLIGRDEQAALLTPWLGPDLPFDSLPLPALVEITEDSNGYDAAGLTARLAGEAPGAVLDDH
ncbi:MAG TPA: cell division protein FtsX, partial [Aliiroseovarius sp.]|nr:cell division protein FtsX [Aliiroseovarius sp.]